MQWTVGTWEPVADETPGVFRAVCEPDAVNVGLVVGEHGHLVIDTGSSPKQGRAIRDAALTHAGVPLAAVAITHAHHDHVGGLAAFDDVPSLGHRSVPGLTRPLALAATVDLGGVHCEVVHFGAGHTGGDAVVVVPERRVVFAGDLLEESGPPQFDADTATRSWPTSLDGVLGMLRPGTRIVPGHGAVMDRQRAFLQRAEIAAVWAEAEHQLGRGVLADAALDAGNWPWERDVMEPILPLVYAELASIGKTPGRRLPVLGL